MDEWKPIRRYPNYEVSDKGRVRDKKTGRVTTASMHNNRI